MSNLYSEMKPRDTLKASLRVLHDHTGNQPLLPAIFPDQLAPVIRTDRDSERVVENLRWGFPPTRPWSSLVTNIRNLSSSYWRGWVGKPQFRCLVPATAFCEYDEGHAKRPTWFALDESRPLFCFAGLWRPWTGARGTQAERQALFDATGSNEQEHHLFAFITCEPNDVVAPVHRKTMPVLLTDPVEWETWLTAPAEEALKLQRPLPAHRLRVVAVGQRHDPPRL